MAHDIGLDDELAVRVHNIQRLTAAKDRLQRELEAIDKDLAIENARYSRLCNAKNPTCQLPIEVMATVFTRVHNYYRYANSKKAVSDALNSLVTMSQVCVRWREVILNTPLLWREIVITFRSAHTRQSALNSLLDAHLERSKTCLLDIVLNFTDNHTANTSILELIGRHSQRWRKISLLVPTAIVAHFQVAFRRFETPMLEHFSIDIESTPDGGPTSPRAPYAMDHLPIFPAGAPQLSFLRLAGGAVGALHPNSNSIETLHLNGWSRSYLGWMQLKQLLENLPRLSSLSLSKMCIRYPRDTIQNPPPIHLPNLSSLRIRDPSALLATFLPSLATPKLQTLHLEALDSFDSAIIPSLRSLSLENCFFDEPEIRDMEAKFPNLESLSCIGDNIEEFSIALSVFPSGKPQWPRLRTLTVRHLAPAEVDSLSSLVISRQESQAPLQTLRLDRRSRTSLRSKGRFGMVSGKAQIEDWDFFERWPPGLGYEDPHDLED